MGASQVTIKLDVESERWDVGGVAFKPLYLLKVPNLGFWEDKHSEIKLIVSVWS